MRKVESQEYKEIVLDIMKRIDKICEIERIEYCLFYGALLGAVRHGGFIPWDDDIDLIMLRSEYDRLRDAITAHPEYNLNFIDISTNSKTIYPFAKVCDVRTINFDEDFVDVDGYGAFVDIFPYDYLPENEKERIKIMNKCKRLNRLRSISSHKKPSMHNKSFVKYCRGLAAYALTFLIDSSKIVKRIDDIGRNSNGVSTKYIGTMRNPKNVYPVEWIFPTEKIDFEKHSFSCPKEIDKCLTKRYGDYMVLPPENERKPHAITCYIKE